MCSIEAHGYIVAGTDYNNFEEPNFKEGPPSDYKYANKPHKNIHRTQKDDVDEQDFNDTSLTRENHAPPAVQPTNTRTGSAQTPKMQTNKISTASSKPATIACNMNRRNRRETWYRPQTLSIRDNRPITPIRPSIQTHHPKMTSTAKEQMSRRIPTR